MTSSAARRTPIESGTLKGFPNPPAMVRAEQSSAAPHASIHDHALIPGVRALEAKPDLNRQPDHVTADPIVRARLVAHDVADVRRGLLPDVVAAEHPDPDLAHAVRGVGARRAQPDA